MDEDDFGKDKKNPFDIVDVSVSSATNAKAGSADFNDNPFDNPFSNMVGESYDLDIPEVDDNYFEGMSYFCIYDIIILFKNVYV